VLAEIRLARIRERKHGHDDHQQEEEFLHACNGSAS
jgi:hypothetical protein